MGSFYICLFFSKNTSVETAQLGRETLLKERTKKISKNDRIFLYFRNTPVIQERLAS